MFVSLFNVFFYCSLQCFLNLGGDHINVLFREEMSTVTYYQYYFLPEVSEFTSINCKDRLSLLKLRAAFIHEHNSKYLKDSLTICQLVVLNSPLWPINIPTLSFYLFFKTMLGFPYVEWASESVRKWLVSLITVIPILHKWKHRV